MMSEVKIIECPRDAMQGIHNFIPTELKVDYLNALLEVGFDTLDFGSFVSPKAIPQMRDTAEVLGQLTQNTSTKLLSIVANARGAEDAVKFERIRYLGYPFSISEEFQKRNTNSSIEESFQRVETIQNLCLKHSKTAVIYISMAFGNPYGEKWHPDIATEWCLRLKNELGIELIALSDTIGVSTPKIITELFEAMLSELDDLEIGAHLHTTPDTWEEKIIAAYTAGCRRFDGALKGYGGCPMAKDDLTGNMPTERMLEWFEKQNISTGIKAKPLEEAMAMSSQVFNTAVS